MKEVQNEFTVEGFLLNETDGINVDIGSDEVEDCEKRGE